MVHRISDPMVKRYRLSTLLCLLAAISPVVYSQERATTGDTQRDANTVNVSKEALVSSTLNNFNTIIAQRLNLLKTCGSQQKHANWSTQQCL